MNTASSLNSRFGIANRIVFKQDPGGLVLMDVVNEQASASLATQGAHLMSWTPCGDAPVIWLSPAAKLVPGKAIRGGVPVCWPWFGPHASEAAFPSHGIARCAPWEVIESRQLSDDATRLVFRLSANETALALWPYASELELHITVGAALELELVTRNSGATPFIVGEALHSYFAVGDVRLARIYGLEDCAYIDKVAGGKLEAAQHGPVTVAGEVDRVYLESSADCWIDDPSLKRRIRIEKRGSRSSVVWNPWREKAAALDDMGEDSYLHMLCVESGNVADNAVSVAPGGEHRLWLRYSVEKGTLQKNL